MSFFLAKMLTFCHPISDPDFWFLVGKCVKRACILQVLCAGFSLSTSLVCCSCCSNWPYLCRVSACLFYQLSKEPVLRFPTKIIDFSLFSVFIHMQLLQSLLTSLPSGSSGLGVLRKCPAPTMGWPWVAGLPWFGGLNQPRSHLDYLRSRVWMSQIKWKEVHVFRAARMGSLLPCSLTGQLAHVVWLATCSPHLHGGVIWQYSSC